ncbi:MAG: helix-turn-helix transcriptional regulator [Firmicutes bacterium]|nr:helix-turn-helix transcriptional regulator [Bacillota bacterium]
MARYSFDRSKRRVSLKAKRVDLELTLEEASKKIGISKYALYNYEHYKNIPNIQTALKIAEAYGVDIDDLKFARDDSEVLAVKNENSSIK